MKFKIQDTDWLDKLTEDAERRLSGISGSIISIILQRVKMFSQNTKNKEHVTKYIADDLRQMKTVLLSTQKFEEKEIDRVFNEVAAANVDFANFFYEKRGISTVKDYRNNAVLKKIVDDLKREQKDGIKNLAKTSMIGFTDRKGKFQSLREEYIKAINEAVTAVRIDENTFYNVMRPLVREMVNSGLETVDFESGYRRRIDSQVRTDLRTGIHELNSRMMKETGKRFSADGYEISVHALCAPDHQDIQGRQYTKNEFEELNTRLSRRIGEMNCNHFITPIIVGVSIPVYTEQQLEDIKESSNRKVTIGEKEYTRYEVSQIMRRYETKMRDRRTAITAFEALGDKKAVQMEKAKLKILRAKYKSIAQKADLTLRWERTRI